MADPYTSDQSSHVQFLSQAFPAALRGLRSVWVKPDKELLQTVGRWLEEAGTGDVLHVVPYDLVVVVTGAVNNFAYKLEPAAKAKKKK